MRRLGTARRRTLAGVLAAAALAAPGARAEPADDPLLVQLGAHGFERHCASCHGLDARGDGPVAGLLEPRPADLTRIAARRRGHFPDDEIARIIDGRRAVLAHGSRTMPVWGIRFAGDVPDPGIAESLVRGQLTLLVAYLRSIQQPPAAEAPPD